MDRRIFGGGPSGTNGPEWRLLRLTDLRESAWQGTAAAGVTGVTQDSSGWITASVDDESAGAKSLVIKDQSGRTYDPAEHGWGLVEVLIEPDSSVWTGSNGEYVYLGLASDDGATSAGEFMFAMINTTSSSGKTASLVSDDVESEAVSGSFNWRLVATMIIGEFAIGGSFATVLRSGMVPVRTVINKGPLAPASPVRLVLSLGVTENIGSGPYSVKFRAWYRVYRAPSAPFP
jgi:hypothetical protein